MQLIFRDRQVAGLFALVAYMALFPNDIYAAPVYPVIGLVGLGLLGRHFLRRRKSEHPDALCLPPSFTPIVNQIAVMMLAAAMLHAGYVLYRVGEESSAIARHQQDTAPANRIGAKSTPFPHIVHIVLDGYSRADVLRRTYGFDNTAFLDALRKRGFRVSNGATTPYNQTLFVMSSIFSLGRITDAIDAPLAEQDQAILRRTLAHTQQTGAVPHLLESLGYRLQSTPSSYLPLQWRHIATGNGNFNTTSHLRLPGTYIFVYDLLRTSPVFGDVAEYLFGNVLGVASVNYRILKDVPNLRFRLSDDRPQFIYQHILAPHPPFNISADGKRRNAPVLSNGIDDGSHLLRGDARKRKAYREGYVEKLRYINHAILKQIDALKKDIDRPVIIILHGDHGGGLHFEQDSKAETCLSERFSPLLAVYATDERIADAFTDDFNIINIYRAVFRNMLDLDLPNLPNRNTFVSWELNSATDLRPGELNASCADAMRPTVAGRPPEEGSSEEAPIAR